MYRPLAALPLCLALAAAPASGQVPTADPVPAPAPAPAPKPAPGPQPAPAPKPAPVVLTVPDPIDAFSPGKVHVEGGDPATFDVEIEGADLEELEAIRGDTLRDFSFTGRPGAYKVTLYYTEGVRNRHVSARTHILAPPAPAPQPSPAPQPAPSPGPIPAPEPVPVPPAPVPAPMPQPAPAPQPATPLEAAAQAYLRNEAASFRAVAAQIRSGAVKRDGIPAAMKAARGPASKAVADQVNAAPDPAAALDAAAAAMEMITR